MEGEEQQQQWRRRFYRKQKIEITVGLLFLFWSMAAQFRENSSFFRMCGLTQNERRRPQKKKYFPCSFFFYFFLHRTIGNFRSPLRDVLCLVYVFTTAHGPLKKPQENKKGTSSPRIQTPSQRLRRANTLAHIHDRVKLLKTAQHQLLMVLFNKTRNTNLY